MIYIEEFTPEDYADLISWIDSEETLMQFGGPQFTFPLTEEQLDASLSDEKRTAFRVVDEETAKTIGHGEIYVLDDDHVKIGRIIIGDKDQRGKGVGKQIVQALLDFAFYTIGIPNAELNVFDFNTAAIKCYEKVGFTINPGKKLERKVKGETWIAINMTITQDVYEDVRANEEE